MPRILELFSGTGSVGRAFTAFGWEVISLDMNPRFKPTICQDIRDAFGGEGDISGALACIVSAVLGEGDISGVLRFWLTSLLQFWLLYITSAVLAYIISAASGGHSISAVFGLRQFCGFGLYHSCGFW